MFRLLSASGALFIAMATPCAATAADKTVSPQDRAYLTTAIAGDRFEIQGGKTASTRTTTPAVKTLADRLVADHGKSLKEAIAVARRLGIKAPGTPTPPMQWELNVSASFTGQAFDRWWSDLEVADHKQDIAEATDEKRDGQNKTIKALAAGEIPTLRTHLKLSDEALQAAGGSPVSGESP